ncbi:MAG: tetratricopeptide repeat protein, partial [Bacteroidota bacterium]|nr:tetratricopeptide repeat protein [Bacteroidota bacterium]
NTEERLASQYYRNKEYDKAAALYEKLYDKSPTKYYYTYYYFCLIQLREYQKANKLVKKQIRKYPQIIKYHVDLGYVYIQAGEAVRAEKEFDEALKKLTPNIAQIKDLANAFYARGQIDYATETYNKGRKLVKNEYGFHFEMANLYKLSGNYTAMIDEYLAELMENPESIQSVQNRLQVAVNNDSEGTVTDYLWKSLLQLNQKNPENLETAEMLLWLSVQLKDFTFALTQAKSLDRRYNEGGDRVFEVAQLCVSNAEYEEAIEAFTYVINKGEQYPYYMESLTGLLNARYLKIINDITYQEEDLLALENDYITTIEAFGMNRFSIPLMRDLAHLQAFYLDKLPESVELLEHAIKIPNAPANTVALCKIELADIYLFSGEVWEATLLYSQVDKAFKNNPLGHLAKYKNARLTYYIGEFEWARAQLDVLKAATSKLIANDAMDLSLLISDNMDPDSSMNGLLIFAKADLLSYQNKDDLALQTLDSIYLIGLYHPLFDEVLFKKAEIMIKKGHYKEADSLLQRVVDYYPFDILADDALFLRAEIQEQQFNNIEQAMDLYQELLLNYPGSLYVVEARKRFRNLRNDNI